MSKLRLTVTKTAETNGSEGILPYKVNNNTFDDSWLGYDRVQSIFYSIDSLSYYGIFLDFKNINFKIGDVLNNIGVSQGIDAVQFNGAGITSGGAPVPTGNFLNIKVNGTSYKLQILQ